DLLVPPLCGPEVARNDARPMDPPEVAEHECIARLRPVGRSFGQTHVPEGVLVPGVGPEEAVLLTRLGLDLPPVAVQDVLPRVDEPSRVSDGPSVQCVTRHSGTQRSTVGQRVNCGTSGRSGRSAAW